MRLASHDFQTPLSKGCGADAWCSHELNAVWNDTEISRNFVRFPLFLAEMNFFGVLRNASYDAAAGPDVGLGPLPGCWRTTSGDERSTDQELRHQLISWCSKLAGGQAGPENVE
jgi:hypothetical protein